MTSVASTSAESSTPHIGLEHWHIVHDASDQVVRDYQLTPGGPKPLPWLLRDLAADCLEAANTIERGAIDCSFWPDRTFAVCRSPAETDDTLVIVDDAYKALCASRKRQIGGESC